MNDLIKKDRKSLQQIAKTWGVKANIKSTEIIEKLLAKGFSSPASPPMSLGPSGPGAENQEPTSAVVVRPKESVTGPQNALARSKRRVALHVKPQGFTASSPAKQTQSQPQSTPKPTATRSSTRLSSRMARAMERLSMASSGEEFYTPCTRLSGTPASESWPSAMPTQGTGSASTPASIEPPNSNGSGTPPELPKHGAAARAPGTPLRSSQISPASDVTESPASPALDKGQPLPRSSPAAKAQQRVKSCHLTPRRGKATLDTSPPVASKHEAVPKKADRAPAAGGAASLDAFLPTATSASPAKTKVRRRERLDDVVKPRVPTAPSGAARHTPASRESAFAFPSVLSGSGKEDTPTLASITPVGDSRVQDGHTLQRREHAPATKATGMKNQHSEPPSSVSPPTLAPEPHAEPRRGGKAQHQSVPGGTHITAAVPHRHAGKASQQEVQGASDSCARVLASPRPPKACQTVPQSAQRSGKASAPQGSARADSGGSATPPTVPPHLTGRGRQRGRDALTPQMSNDVTTDTPQGEAAPRGVTKSTPHNSLRPAASLPGAGSARAQGDLLPKCFSISDALARSPIAQAHRNARLQETAKWAKAANAQLQVLESSVSGLLQSPLPRSSAGSLPGQEVAASERWGSTPGAAACEETGKQSLRRAGSAGRECMRPGPAHSLSPSRKVGAARRRGVSAHVGSRTARLAMPKKLGRDPSEGRTAQRHCDGDRSALSVRSRSAAPTERPKVKRAFESQLSATLERPVNRAGARAGVSAGAVKAVSMGSGSIDKSKVAKQSTVSALRTPTIQPRMAKMACQR